MLAATAVVGGVVAVFNMLPASAATCAVAWQSSAVYTGGAPVPHNGRTSLGKGGPKKGAPPGPPGVGQAQGPGGGSPPTPPTQTGSAGGCNFPAWVQGRNYVTGDV